MFQDQFSPLDYFRLRSKTFYNGTLIRLPLKKAASDADLHADTNARRYPSATLSLLLAEELADRIIVAANEHSQHRVRLHERLSSVHEILLDGQTIVDGHSRRSIAHANLARDIAQIDQ